MAWATDANPELDALRALIREELVYPRQARLPLPPALPSEGASAEQNAEWLRIAQALRDAGVLKMRTENGRTTLQAVERTTDVVVPSVNLRYEPTAYNLVLGTWDIELRDSGKSGDLIMVQGRRHYVQRSRVYEVVMRALDPPHAAALGDRDMAWQVTRSANATTVREVAK